MLPQRLGTPAHHPHLRPSLRHCTPHALGRVQRVERHSPWSLQVRVELDEAPVLHVVRRPSSPERRGRRHLGILGPVAQVPEYGIPHRQGLTLSILEEVLERRGPQCSRQRKARLPNRPTPASR